MTNTPNQNASSDQQKPQVSPAQSPQQNQSNPKPGTDKPATQQPQQK